jgi:integrase
VAVGYIFLVTYASEVCYGGRMENVIRRGLTFYARYRIPEDRWGDVGLALKAAGGIKREIVKTLQTKDAREAKQRRAGALAAIEADLDRALRRAGKKPLGADWTANWMDRAVDYRSNLNAYGSDILNYIDRGDGEPPDVMTYRDITMDDVESDADALESKHGLAASRQFLEVALGEGLTVAEGQRQWLATLSGVRRVQTIKGHAAAIGKLEGFLKVHKGWASLEGVGIDQVTKRIAGDFLAHCCTLTSLATVQREASAYNGLWRWAVRRGYTKENPWEDQTTGLRAQVDGPQVATKRGYTTPEIVALLRAGTGELAPNKGGYAATYWDLMRLLLLTGARPEEILSLRRMDIIAAGTAVALAAHEAGGKTKNAKRILPLHAYARAVVAARLAALPDTSPEASLWPEVPAQGDDARRTKTISTRFVAIRRRLLPKSAGVDLYSLRRSFMTASETAKNAGGRLDDGLIARLAGHGQGHLALDVYSDWSRLGRPELSGELLTRLATLTSAVDDVVALGFSEEVIKALAETSDFRPAVVRTAPAFSRMSANLRRSDVRGNT